MMFKPFLMGWSRRIPGAMMRPSMGCDNSQSHKLFTQVGSVAIRRSSQFPMLVPTGEATSPRNSFRHVAARLLCYSQRMNGHKQRQKCDPAEALSIGHHAGVRAVVCRLPVESAQSRRDDARARPVRRSFHNSPLDRQAGSGAGVEEAFRKRKRKRGIGAVGKSWRLDETYIKSRGEDRYWYRTVDKQGNTVDFLLTATRDRRAAQRFFTRAVKNNRLPKIVNIDKSGANNAGIKDYSRTIARS